MAKETSYERLLRGDGGAPDECWPWEWSHTGDGYGRVHIPGTPIKTRVASRVAYEVFVGEVPDDKLVDHTCHNRGCWNPKHLRLADQKQNMENRVDRAKNNTSGWRGIVKSRKRWRPVVQHHGKKIYGKSYACPTAAGLAAISMRRELGFLE